MEKNHNIKRILRYMGKDRIWLALVLIIVALGASFSVIGPKLLGNATTALVDEFSAGPANTEFDFSRILRPVLIAAAFYVISFLAQAIQGYIMTIISQRLIYVIRQEISDKINNISYGLIERRPVGEVLSIICNDVDQVGTGFNDFLTQSLNIIVTLVGITGVMFYINPVLAAIVLISIPLRIIYVRYNIKRSGKFFFDQQVKLAEVFGYVEENFTGFEVVKSFATEKESEEKFTEINDELAKATGKSFLMTSLLSPVMIAIGNIAYIGVIIVGSLFAIRGIISVGDIQAFLSYVNNSNGPIQQISTLSSRYLSLKTSLTRIFEFLDLPEEENDSDESAENQTEVLGDVDFENVVFGYRKDKMIINDFSLAVKKGQKIAIVGLSGCGKTTLVKLLMRFYDINEGSIKVEGLDLRKWDRRRLRSNFGMVLQDTWLFCGSVKENIRFGRSDATDEEVYKAAREAKADDFIRLLPGGYDFVLNEDGNNLSTGQKQLITIARAFLANAPIMILDEATSNVDTRTEMMIQEAMRNLMAGRTCFIIAHRLSTIKSADTILVLKDGNVVEQGNHSELMQRKGFYCDLYNAQYE